MRVLAQLPRDAPMRFREPRTGELYSAGSAPSRDVVMTVPNHRHARSADRSCWRFMQHQHAASTEHTGACAAMLDEPPERALPKHTTGSYGTAISCSAAAFAVSAHATCPIPDIAGCEPCD